MNNLSISEIAWPLEMEQEVFKFLTDKKIARCELAPMRSFGDVLTAEEGEVIRRADTLRALGLAPSSFQALLFGQDGLFLFDGSEARQRLMDVLKACGRVAGWAGAGPMVFGSPKNRLRGSMSLSEANKIAVDFFREVGDFCAGCGSTLVMEANPEQYGADFCTRLDQAAELVAAVDSPGFKLHLDGGGMALSGEDFEPVVRQSADLIGHVHASQPMLVGFDEPHPVHARMAKVLKEINYSGDVAIEMRAQEDVMAGVRTAVEAVRRIYG